MFAGGFDLAGGGGAFGQPRRVRPVGRGGFVGAQVAGHGGAAGGHARYGLLETIRQFAQEQLAATGTIGEVRDRHARYFAEQAVAHWDMWDGPGQRVALDWVDVEFANLRAGFRWAADQDDLATAAAIAAHTAMLAGSCSVSSRPGGPRRSSRRPPPPTWPSCPACTPPPACATYRAA